MISMNVTGGKLFCDRDIFVHDGSHLRKVRLTARAQFALALVAGLLLAWASFVTVRLVTPGSGNMDQVIAATEARTAQLEQRQAIMEKIIRGEDVDASMLAASAGGAPLPAAVEASLDRAERRAVIQAALLSARFEQRYEQQAAALKALGIAPAPSSGAVGGPFEAVKSGDATFQQLFNSWKKLDNLADGAIAVPSEKPVRTAAFTSGFGVRSDPFQSRAAMHPGIDLAGPIGTPIYATADGTVMRAGWNSGGYGNLVEVDHGKGITTRYGHMSRVLVAAGQHITRGQQIGMMGSTGRSTGSHLHYEVRIDGRAVNPIPFMKTNDYLLAMQEKGHSAGSMDTVALGGPQR